MLGVFVDIENELADIEQEVAMLVSGMDIYMRERVGAEPAWSWLAIQGIASAVEKIYSGCERVMGMIASEIDGAKIDRSNGWHISLLKRMAHTFPGMREPAITNDTYLRLDRLRAFRHRARNSYGLSLNPDIVLERAAEVRIAFDAFRSDLAQFAERMTASTP